MIRLKTSKKDIPGRESLLVNFSSKSRYAESYRTLRTNIYFSLMERELSSLVITSSLQSEGKTTTVANLAYTIAQTGKKVLMVDGDLRKPGLSTRFGVQKAIGFSNIVGDILGRHINKGKVSEYGLADLIRLNNLQARTCIITLGNGKDEANLYFLKGKLVDVYWKNRPEDKKLASTLIQEKLLTESEARLALGQQKKSVRRLGSVLLTMGLVEEKDLNRILSLQVMEAFRVATEMVDAEFAVKSVSEDQIQLSSTFNVDFQSLTEEFIETDEEASYIRHNIDSNILETDEKNLYLLPSGSIPPNPSELIGSKRTNYFLAQLKNRFDVVIIDSSPIIPASDVLLLAPQADGVVLVVETGKTNRNLAKDAVQQLEKARANIFGVLLNRADVTKGNYYKYYQSYYGS